MIGSSTLRRALLGLLAAGACAATTLSPPAGAGWQPRFQQVASLVVSDGVVTPQSVTTSIDTIQPSARWAGAAGALAYADANGTANASAAPIVDTTTVLGAQTISAVDSDGGLIRLTVPSTAGMTDGEQWTVTGVAGTVEANSIWKLKVLDATHVDLCTDFDASNACSGSVFTNAYQGGGTIGFNQTVIGNLSEPPYTWIEDSHHTITVIAGNGTRAWVKKVTFCLEGTCKDVTQQSVNPDGTRGGTLGWSITPLSRQANAGASITAADGDANLYVAIEPYNGMRRLLGPIPFVLNSNGTIPRPRILVDGVNGLDTGDGSASKPYKTLSAAWASVRNASGAVIDLMAAQRTCQLAAGSPAVFTCPGTDLRPPATIHLSGIPSDATSLSQDAIYYILADSFAQAGGSTSFTVSLQPPGTSTANAEPANNGTATKPPFQIGVPVNVAGAGGSVAVSGSIYVEDATPQSGFPIARMVKVEPYDDYRCQQGLVQSATCRIGNVTLAQSSRAVQTSTLKAQPSLINLDDITIDTSTLSVITLSSSPQYLTVSNSRAVDPNGPKPPYGYYIQSSLPLVGTAFNTSAFIDSVSSNFVAPEAGITRNARVWNSFDTIQTAAGSANFVVDNLQATKWGNWYSGIITSFTGAPTDVAVASVGSTLSYEAGKSSCVPNSTGTNCYSTLTLSGYSGAIPDNPANGTITFYSGALNGKTYLVATTPNGTGGAAAINRSTGVLSIAGDIRAAQPGDKVFWGNQGHGDIFQVIGGVGQCNVSALSNSTVQRYKAARAYTFLPDHANGIVETGYQGFLGQAGVCSLSNSPIAVSGTTVTAALPLQITAVTTKTDNTKSTAISFTNARATAYPTTTTTNNADGSTTVTTTDRSAGIYPQVNQFLDLGNLSSAVGYQRNSARVIAVSDNGTDITMKLARPLPGGDVLASANVTSWALGIVAKDLLFTNSILDEDPGELFQPQHGQDHWVFANTTLIGSWANRMDQKGFGLEAFQIFDSLLPSLITSSGNTASTAGTPKPVGISVSNVSQLGGAATPMGPYHDAASSIVLDGLYKPSGAKTLRSAPMVPLDYNGAVRSLTSSIGAVN